MPLYRVATAPDELDASADAIVESKYDARAPHLRRVQPPASGQSPNKSPSKSLVGPFLVEAESASDINKNTSWFSYPGVWSMYFIILTLVWMLAKAILGCTSSEAWVITNIVHFAVTFYLFHWKKGSPFSSDDQGQYGKLTWWEQMDSGRQLTRNRKFLTLMPVLLFVLVTVVTRHDKHANSLFLLNTLIVFVLVIAKLPMLHKIRIFGINA